MYYKVNLQRPGASQQAIISGLNANARMVEVTVNSDESGNVSSTTIYKIPEAVLESVEWFKIGFDSDITFTGTEIGSTIDLTMYPENTQVVWEKALIPWLYSGIPEIFNLRLSVAEWAQLGKIMDFFLEPRCCEQACREMINQLNRLLVRNGHFGSREQHCASIASAWETLRDLPYRFAIVHCVYMAQEHAGVSMHKLHTALKDTNFARDYFAWSSIVPNVQRRLHYDYAINGIAMPEENAWPIDQILMPLLFISQPMPDWYKPSVPDTGDGVRKSVRDFLGMN